MEFIVWIPSKKNFFFCRYDRTIEGTGRPRWWLQCTTPSTNYLLTPNLQVYRLQRWNFWISTQSLKKTFKGTTCCRPHWVPQLLLYCRSGEIWKVSSALTSRWKKIWRRRGQGRLIWRVWTLGEAMGKTMVSLYTGNTATHRSNTQCVWVTW